MCGLNGIFAYGAGAPAPSEAELVMTRDRMAARGPDGAGLWRSPDGLLSLGHRRLSIIDLSDRGAQPMVRAYGRFAIVFNGEIYNYQALRAELVDAGVTFHSDTDTEVILELFIRQGEAMLSRLRGMFAFAIWDGKQRSLTLARDGYGIKPLYYADDGETLRFASEVKALVAGGAIPRTLEPAGLVGFCLFGSVPEPFTTLRAVRSLPAGHVMRIEAGRQATPPRAFFSLAHIYTQAERNPSNGCLESEEMRSALRASVASHLVADVPVGVFLSAGIDSGALVGLMRDAGQTEIQTLTLAFKEFRGQEADESPLAEQVAAHYGTHHTTCWVSEQEFREDFPNILAAMDQPTVDGINTWFVSKAARELGLKVMVSGLGGDELFGGYPAFRDIPRWARRFGPLSRIPGLPAMASSLAAIAIRAGVGLNPKAAGLISLGRSLSGLYLLRRGIFLPSELTDELNPDLVSEGLHGLGSAWGLERLLDPEPKSWFARIATLESAAYMRNQLLRDTDWASMSHSLEVRTPFVDTALLAELAPRLTAGGHRVGKDVLANAPTTPLPKEVVLRSKTGFETPIARWQQGLSEPSSGIVAPIQSARVEPWARIWCRHILAMHDAGLPSAMIA